MKNKSALSILITINFLLSSCAPTTPLASPTNDGDQTAPAPTSLSPLGETGEGSSTPTQLAFTNPFTPEQTAALTDGGYVIGTDGTVKDRSGRAFLTSSPDGKSWMTLDGKEYPKTELHIVVTNGVDFTGKDIGAMLVFGEGKDKMMVLPTTGETVKPLDIAANQALIDRNDSEPNPKDWGSYENVQLEELPEMTWEDFKSGRLFYSEILALKPWPENVYVRPLQYHRQSVITNVWALSQYPYSDGELAVFGYPSIDRPIVAENDMVMNLSAYRMRDPITKQWMVVKGQQYLYEDHAVVLHMFFGDDLTKPSDEGGLFGTVQKSLSNPSWVITEPIVSLLPGEYCGDGGLGASFPQQSICDLQGYGGLPQVRSLLPLALQQLMKKFDIEGQLSGMATETYPVGAEIYKLQRLALAQYSGFQRRLDWYLRPEADPAFNELYPDK